MRVGVCRHDSLWQRRNPRIATCDVIEFCCGPIAWPLMPLMWVRLTRAGQRPFL